MQWLEQLPRSKKVLALILHACISPKVPLTVQKTALYVNWRPEIVCV